MKSKVKDQKIRSEVRSKDQVLYLKLRAKIREKTIGKYKRKSHGIFDSFQSTNKQNLIFDS